MKLRIDNAIESDITVKKIKKMALRSHVPPHPTEFGVESQLYSKKDVDKDNQASSPAAQTNSSSESSGGGIGEAIGNVGAILAINKERLSVFEMEMFNSIDDPSGKIKEGYEKEKETLFAKQKEGELTKAYLMSRAAELNTSFGELFDKGTKEIDPKEKFDMLSELIGRLNANEFILAVL